MPNAGISVVYVKLLAKYPVLIKMLTSGTMFMASDLIAQLAKQVAAAVGTRDCIGPADRRRFSRLQSLHAFIIGSGAGYVWHHYYRWTDQILVPKFMPSNKFLSTVSTVAFDQFVSDINTCMNNTAHDCITHANLSRAHLVYQVWTPFWYNAFFFPLRSILNGAIFKGLGVWRTSIKNSIKHEMVPVWIKNIAVWGPANMLIFGLVPTSLKPLASNLAGLGWGIILSSLTLGDEEPAQEAKVRSTVYNGHAAQVMMGP
jgi:hypothetical protein